MKSAEFYTKCSRGAITLYFENGDANSFKEENMLKLGITLPERAGINSYCCNHCVNHYGLDLCACGSGETPENCKEGYSECGNPMEEYGIAVEFAPKVVLLNR